MRADRLLSMLMILQSQGKVSARELASKLEVSVRTVHRDVLALSVAGVPVYTIRGPDGGIALVDRYRSDLTGLTKDEVRALFMMSIPPALTELGLGQEIQAAMLKLSAALPTTFREDEQNVRQRIHIDPEPWEKRASSESASDLLTLQDAVWESRMLQIRHRSWYRPDMGTLDARIQPYGLVAKTNRWYLVGKREDHIAVLRVDRIEELRILDQTFERPADFDLAAFWEAYCTDEIRNRPTLPVSVLADPAVLPSLPWFLGEGIQIRVNPDANPDFQGRIQVELQFEYFDQALKGILPLGRAVEVIEPFALRCTVKDYGEQIAKVYT